MWTPNKGYHWIDKSAYRVATEIVRLITRVSAYPISLRCRHNCAVPRGNVNAVIDGKRRADYVFFCILIPFSFFFNVFFYYIDAYSLLRLSCTVPSRFSRTCRRTLLYTAACQLYVSSRYTVPTRLAVASSANFAYTLFAYVPSALFYMLGRVLYHIAIPYRRALCRPLTCRRSLAVVRAFASATFAAVLSTDFAAVPYTSWCNNHNLSAKFIFIYLFHLRVNVMHLVISC